MIDARTRRMRRLMGLWLALGVLLALGHRPLYNTLWLLLVYVWGLYALLGLALLIAVLQLPRRTGVPYAALTLAGAAVLWFGYWTFASWGERPYFAWRNAHYWPRYRAVVADVLRDSGPPTYQPRWTEWRGVHFMVDSGPPLRIAFLQPGGLLDNWEGFVYDPTGRVATATGWRAGAAGQYTAAPDVFKLFGGDLVRCEPIEVHYFRCWFT